MSHSTQTNCTKWENELQFALKGLNRQVWKRPNADFQLHIFSDALC